MIQHWTQNAIKFERVKELFRKGGDGTRFTGKSWYLPVKTLSATEMTELRYLAGELRLIAGYIGHDNEVYLFEQDNGVIRKGYAYLDWRPRKLETDLSETPQHSGNYYQHPGGNWYLYMVFLG